MGQLEILAALLGLANVLLVIRRSIWNYPFGIAMVAIYFFVFYDARLYADALLQIFFLVIQGYGWINWRRSGIVSGVVTVERLHLGARVAWLSGTGAAILCWAMLMARFTDAAAPFLDSAVAGLSVSAQWLLALRKVESWVLWIAVDILAVGLFLSRGLMVTAALYGLFLILAVAGLFAWARNLERSRPRMA